MRSPGGAGGSGGPGEAPENLRYWAFLSYSHADEKAAKRLHRALERYRVPRDLRGKELPEGGRVPKRLFPVFRDQEELPGSSDLGREIEDALRRSRYLVVLCSPRAAASVWVDEEVRRFKEMGRSERILCLLLDGEPGAAAAGRPADEAFPPGVRFEVDDAGRLTDRPAEPLAADQRPGQDPPRRAFVRLVAGMLGVGFDDLWRRDLRRRRKRAALVSTTSLLLVSVLGVGAARLMEARAERRAALLTRESALTAEQDPRMALLQILEALRISRTPDRVDDLRSRLDEAAERVRLVHAGEVREVVADSSLSRVVTSTERGVWLWELASDRTVAIPAPGAELLALSADGRTLATSRGADITLHALPDGEPTGTLQAGDEVLALALDGDGSRLAAALAGGTAAVWETRHASGPPLLLRGHAGRVLAVALSVAGDRVLTGGIDGEAVLWDVATGEALRRIPHRSRVRSVALGPEGELLTVPEGGRPRLWPAPEPGREGVPWIVPVDGVVSAALSPDGALLALGADALIHVLDAPGRDSVPLVVLRGHRGRVTRVGVPSGAPAHVVSAGADSTVRLWDGGRARLSAHRSGIADVTVSADGRRALVRGLGTEVTIWDLETGRARTVPPPEGHRILHGVFDPSGSRVATAASDGTVTLRDAADGRVLRILEGPGARLFRVAFAGGGEVVVAGSEEGTVLLWEAGSGTLIHAVGLHAGAVRALAVAADGGRLATGADDGLAVVWTLEGRAVDSVRSAGPVSSVAFAPGDTFWTAASLDGTVHLRDLPEGRELATLLHPAPAEQATFGRDGTVVATVAADEVLRLWRSATGWAPDTLGREGGPVEAAVFSPDGARLAVVGRTSGPVGEPRAELWSPDGTLLTRLPGHHGRGRTLGTAAFSPDGGVLLTAGMDGDVRVHTLDVDRLLRLADSLLVAHRTLRVPAP